MIEFGREWIPVHSVRINFIYYVLYSDRTGVRSLHVNFAEASFPNDIAKFPFDEAKYPFSFAGYPFDGASYPIDEAKYLFDGANYLFTFAQYLFAGASCPIDGVEFPFDGAKYPFSLLGIHLLEFAVGSDRSPIRTIKKYISKDSAKRIS